MKSCLILVDIQNDYFAGGKMVLVGMEEAAARAQSLLAGFRAANLPVIHIQHVAARPDASFFLPETHGAEIHPMVAPAPGEPVLVKHFPNSFRHTPLLDTLQEQGICDLTICGAMSHMCIDATTRAAFDFGFNCTVAEDACATRDLVFKGKPVKAAEVHAAFMAALSVPYAQISPTRELLERLS
ncbi:isochorismatase [Geomonas limicola]|uniref:Isochorismatase n=1 Tax=Geomonas limicola TaxID=2740186 RepID=A0A6V8NCX0_9BACT|nr:cysteine hydrolase family protein [Geomonas limicola]GFO69724.1 isochorismatase [Geomonas limicola]